MLYIPYTFSFHRNDKNDCSIVYGIGYVGRAEMVQMVPVDFELDPVIPERVNNILPSDLTYIPCKDGFLYLTCVLDLFDRKLIGWSISDHMNASHTVVPAIRMANRNRPFGEGMIFHSDRGIQYACKQTVNLLKSLKLEQSMSGKGNCWDNAVAESFFKTFKSELVYGTKLKTREQMRLYVFEYIESWYNHKRRFSALGNLTIDEFWNQYNIKKESIKNVA